MNPEQRLAHYGYEIHQSGEFWGFSPHGRAALYPSREQALARATSALNVELARCERMMALRATEPVAA